MAGRITSWAQRAWLTIEEPRWVTLAMLTVYALAAVIGVTTIIHPPTSVVGAWGDSLTLAWGLLMLVSSVVGWIGCRRGMWWLEVHGIQLLLLGFALRIVLVVTLHFAVPGSRATQAAELLIAALLPVTRWLRIRDFAIDPTRSRPHDTTHR